MPTVWPDWFWKACVLPHNLFSTRQSTNICLIALFFSYLHFHCFHLFLFLLKIFWCIFRYSRISAFLSVHKIVFVYLSTDFFQLKWLGLLLWPQLWQNGSVGWTVAVAGNMLVLLKLTRYSLISWTRGAHKQTHTHLLCQPVFVSPLQQQVLLRPLVV